MIRTRTHEQAIPFVSAGAVRRLSLTLLAGAVIATIAALPAQASTLTTHSVVVSYGDLDLRDPKGIDSLYQRISSAAREVCGEASVRELQAQAAVRACEHRAVAQAIARVGHPALTSLHHGRRGGTQLG
jgi:UrcA family protein